jgi:H+-transporting ATPase
MLMVIVMLTGDFLSMSLTTDRVRPSGTPNSWQIGRITSAGAVFGACLLIFCTGILALGVFVLHLPIAALRTLSVVSIVFGSQATIYAIRERTHFLGLRPTLWLLGSSVADIAIISTFALRGIAMSPLSLSLLGGELAAAVLFGLVLNGLKIPIFGSFSFPDRHRGESGPTPRAWFVGCPLILRWASASS